MLEQTTAKPTKNFFVNLFTQDIDIEGAIFDLVDNSLDGANRAQKHSRSGDKYSGKWIKLAIDSQQFSLTDNCGGIPEHLVPYAFRFGRDKNRPKETADTVGIYGIGMKRSMYRIGTSGRVVSQNEDREFEVHFSEDWTKNDDDWDLPITTRKKKSLDEPGTCFRVENLREEVRADFADPDFIKELTKSLAQYYSYVIKCGLKLSVNDREIKPLSLMLHMDLTSKGSLRPHVFELAGKDVNVFGYIGLRPGKITNDEDEPNSRELAGITIVCNDRVVLYCNKDWRTGWGESPVPHFHNQFIGISGIVMFSGKADAIPMATDKRQLKLESDIFAAAKVSIKKGIKRFTEMTNKWKGREKELRQKISSIGTVDLDDLRSFASQQKHIKLRRDRNLEKFFTGEARESSASFPEPPKLNQATIKIAYSVEQDEYETVMDYLFHEEEADPATVGKKCFDLQLSRALLR